MAKLGAQRSLEQYKQQNATAREMMKLQAGQGMKFGDFVKAVVTNPILMQRAQLGMKALQKERPQESPLTIFMHMYRETMGGAGGMGGPSPGGPPTSPGAGTPRKDLQSMSDISRQNSGWYDKTRRQVEREDAGLPPESVSEPIANNSIGWDPMQDLADKIRMLIGTPSQVPRWGYIR